MSSIKELIDKDKNIRKEKRENIKKIRKELHRAGFTKVLFSNNLFYRDIQIIIHEKIDRIEIKREKFRTAIITLDEKSLKVIYELLRIRFLDTENVIEED